MECVFKDTPVHRWVPVLMSPKGRNGNLKNKDMERPNFEERLDIIQGLIDRLLYLEEEKDLKEFMEFLEALYCVYPIPRKILYGAAAMRSNRQEDKCK